MINATDIKKMTDESNADKYKILIKIIDTRIIDAAKDGKYEILEQTDNVNLLKIMMNHYRNLGFVVSHPTPIKENEELEFKITISWYS